MITMFSKSVKVSEKQVRYMEVSSLSKQVLLNGIGGKIYNDTDSYLEKCPASLL